MESGRIRRSPERPSAPGGGPRRSPPAGFLALQRMAGNRAARSLVPQRRLDRFAEAGHKLLGDLAWDRDKLELAPGFTISFGDAVALGDWFSSFEQVKALAAVPGKKLGTRGELHYVLWSKIWGRPEGEKMDVLYDRWVKHNRDQAYRYLKSQNIGHFPFPESGDTGRARRTLDVGGSGAGAAYRKRHEQAMHMALGAGAKQGKIDDAMLADAFACHFLTDAFSADHARAPRASIKAYWDKKVPGFDKKLIGWLTSKIHHGSWGVAKRVGAAMFLGGRIETLTRTELSILMTGFGFGDVVSLVAHDAESARGVEADAGGNRITLVGDEGLIDTRTNVTPAAANDTVRAAGNAVRASIDDVFEAYNAGWFSRDWGSFVMGRKGDDGLYTAERLMPTPVPDAQLPADRRTLAWQHPTVEAFLQDQRIGAALVTWGTARKKDLEDAIKDQEPEARDVIGKVLIGPLASRDPKRITALLREILAYR